MQIWIIRQWQTRLLPLFSMCLIVGLPGCAWEVQTIAPVTTARTQWQIEVKQDLVNARYTVQPGDTLWRIAKINGVSVDDLASKNQIAHHHRLHPGQILQIKKSVSQASSNPATAVTTLTKKIKKSNGQGNLETDVITPARTSEAPAPSASASASADHQAIQWHWPTNGKIIEHFSTTNGGNRGIDMAGTRGQAIYGSADGRIVYAGNALRGYGNLLIIKHGEDYLSAYAHNATLLVREQQLVKAKQKIATMGSNGTRAGRLHFEIRYKGKSVDPLRYLPSR